MYFRPIVPVVMRNFSSYWIRKLVNLITTPWIPIEQLKDVREMRRIVELMDNGSKKAFAEKKAALETPASLFPADVQSEVDDLKPGRRKDMMDIMRQFHNVLVRLLLRYTQSRQTLCLLVQRNSPMPSCWDK
jgi:hypothetical protein